MEDTHEDALTESEYFEVVGGLLSECWEADPPDMGDADEVAEED